MPNRMLEDPNRTDPPEEFNPFNRFLDYLTEPEERYIDRPDDYPPVSESELEAAKIQAAENNRLLDIRVAQMRKQYDKGQYRLK